MNKKIWDYLTWAWISLPFVVILFYEMGPVGSDILKTLFGSFFGATLAFLFNWWLKHESREREDLTAGLRALYAIRAQFDDFINVRYAFRHHLGVMENAVRDEPAGVPAWVYAKPIAFNFNPSNHFDFESLGFLLREKTGRGTYERLQFIERTYLDLAGRFEDMNESTQELQEKTSDVFKNNLLRLDAPFVDMEQILGPQLPARVTSCLQALLVRIDRDEQRYHKAFGLLNTELNKRFGDVAHMSELVIPEKCREENLPQIPPGLKQLLDGIPDEVDDAV